MMLMNSAHQALIDATREFFISNENIILIHSGYRKGDHQ
jgi:hypothetical protein